MELSRVYAIQFSDELVRGKQAKWQAQGGINNMLPIPIKFIRSAPMSVWEYLNAKGRTVFHLKLIYRVLKQIRLGP